MQAWAPIQKTDAERAAANLDQYNSTRLYPRVSTLAGTVAFLGAPA